jgi:hypothetical protein
MTQTKNQQNYYYLHGYISVAIFWEHHQIQAFSPSYSPKIAQLRACGAIFAEQARRRDRVGGWRRGGYDFILGSSRFLVGGFEHFS